MKTLHLVLKRKWWDMIQSGIKTEEYREIKPYWEKRLIKFENAHLLRGLFFVTFQLGYQKNAPRMTFELESISIGKGNPLWGAPDKEVFIIKLGKRK